MTTSVGADARQRPVRGVVEGAGTSTRWTAAAVMLLPSLGVGVAVYQVATRGVRAGELILLLVGYLATFVGVTVGFHRHFAHRAFETSRFLQLVLAALGSMAAQGPLLFWVATHRRHHAYSDRQGDPHSPNLFSGPFRKLRGLLHAHIGWMLSTELTSWSVFAKDLLRSRWALLLHKLYFPALAFGLIAPSAVGWLLWGGLYGALNGLLWGGFVRMWLVNQASWCVGSFAHMYGSRRFNTPDSSMNNWIVALLTGGEGLQNNHHAFPSSAMHRLRRWEPDWAGTVIGVLRSLGLIWNVKQPSPEAIQRAASADRIEPPGAEHLAG